jgi:hypothetical protein
MARHHINYDMFLEEMAKQGTNAYEASQLPEAQRAHFLDEQLDKAETRTRKDWPTRLDHFESSEEFKAAMADPAYKVNPHYRAKVHDMLAKSAPEIGAENVASGKSTQDDLSGESMLAAARKDAAIAAYKKLAVEAAHDPQARLALLTMLNSDDPAIQEWINEGTSSVANEGPLQKAFREAGHSTHGPDLGRALASEEEDNGSSGASRLDPANSPVVSA